MVQPTRRGEGVRGGMGMGNRCCRLACAVAGAALLAWLGLSSCVTYLDPQCDDQIRQGDETGIDCGGPECGPCDIGEGCLVNSDCDQEEASCVDRVCTALPCNNDRLDDNNGETDIDCGGSECRPCSGQRTCAVDDDCFSQVCVPETSVCQSLTLSFAEPVSYFSGTKTYALFSGDLNNDGFIDLV